MTKMNNENPLKRVAVYVRVSTDRQAKKGDSLAEQQDTLQKYVNEHNMILHSVYIDDGISGQKLDRDEFSRLMEDVKSNQVDLIIFTKLDRWFRSLRHYLNTQATLEKYNIGWLAVSQPFYDTTTAQGRAFVAQSMTFAELEAQTDSERILSTFEYKVKVGEVISGTTPLGYSIKNKHLVVNDDAEKVVKIYEYYQKNPNLRACMRYAADELGILRGHAQFRKLMQNTKYKGEYRNNLHYCPSIVSKELWEECNQLLKRNQRANKTHDYVFSGLLYCAHCGYRLSSCSVRHRRRADGTQSPYTYPSYRCQCKLNKLNVCDNVKVYNEKTLERRLLEIIKDEIKKYISEYEITSAPAVDNMCKQKKLEEKISKLKDLYLNDLITLEEYKIDKNNYEKLISSLPKPSINPTKDLGRVRELLDCDINELYPALDIQEKNQFWRSFIDKISIDKEHNLDIHFK